MKARRFLGIVISPANVQDEGLTAVMDNICRAGATAIAIDPWLLWPAAPDRGSRMPDLHIDGYRRLLGRPLFGRRALHVETFPAFDPTLELYQASRYKPAIAAVPPEIDRTIPDQLIEEGHRLGMEVHIGLAPFLPPDLLPEDRPRQIDGRTLPPPYIAANGCPNQLQVRAYALAAIEDLLLNYPAVDGLILDWAEFGAYRLEEHFTCFCPACEEKAAVLNYDWTEITAAVLALWNWLHNLTPALLDQARRLYANPAELIELLTAYPGLLNFFRFKADCVTGFYEEVRRLMDSAGWAQTALSARGWISPWNRSSGMDYRRLAGICSAVLPKLFTFDHAVLPRWVGQTLQHWNPALPEPDILETVKMWLNLPDDIQGPVFADYHIPAPDDPHPAYFSSYEMRLEETATQVNGRSQLLPIAHPYLPDEQWRRMVALIRDSPADGMWVNFYSYLTDQKFEIMGQEWLAKASQLRE